MRFTINKSFSSCLTLPSTEKTKPPSFLFTKKKMRARAHVREVILKSGGTCVGLEQKRRVESGRVSIHVVGAGPNRGGGIGGPSGTVLARFSMPVGVGWSDQVEWSQVFWLQTWTRVAIFAAGGWGSLWSTWGPFVFWVWEPKP